MGGGGDGEIQVTTIVSQGSGAHLHFFNLAVL